MMKQQWTFTDAPRVALVSGFWGQNIGNAFFNVGGKWILEQIFGSTNVGFVQDQPGYRTFHNQKNGNPKNDIEYLRLLDLDYIVLQGPLLTEGFQHLWRPTFKELTRRGTKIILMGAAFFKFRDAELKAAKSFLEEFPPALISTRDSRSFEILSGWDLSAPLYDGLDSAFFAPKAFSPFKVHDCPYYAFNFDRYPEPTIELNGQNSSADFHFDADGAAWDLTTPSFVSKLAHRSKVQAYLGHLLDRRDLPETLNNKLILRPEHRYNPHMTYKIYQHKNALASDEPWTYFSIYANSTLTLADRVHACVATLAYGNPAMLFTPSPRAALFERVGCGDIKKHPVILDLEYLEEERMKQLEWLKSKI